MRDENARGRERECGGRECKTMRITRIRADKNSRIREENEKTQEYENEGGENDK
jgi:hypothetical protein